MIGMLSGICKDGTKMFVEQEDVLRLISIESILDCGLEATLF